MNKYNHTHNTSDVALYLAEKHSRNIKRMKRNFYIKTAVISILTAGVTTTLIASFLPKETQECEAEISVYGTNERIDFETGNALYTYNSSISFTPLNCGLSEELQEYTYYLCKAYLVDFDFVMAVMCIESQFTSNIISKTDDYGLMQINIINHAWLSSELGIDDFSEPYGNIYAGVYILRGLFEKYEEPERVLMCYNMGEYAANVLWEHGVHSTDYSEKIIAQAEAYRNA